MPKVSIVIPTFNRPELVKKAIQSAIAQTYTDYEVIIVDDGDKIRSRDVVEGFCDARLRYISHDPSPRGGSAARNTGIRSARGDYIAFLDDDDEWLPEKLHIQMERFEKTGDDVGFCVTSARMFSEKGEIASEIEDGVHDFFNIALVRFKGFLTTTLLVKRPVFDTVGMFDEELPSHQESELMLRITQKYKGLGISTPLVIMNMYEHEHIGGNLDRRINGRETVLRKHAELFSKHPDKLAKHYFWLGLWYREKGNRQIAADLFWRAFMLSKNPRYLVHTIINSFIFRRA